MKDLEGVLFEGDLLVGVLKMSLMRGGVVGKTFAFGVTLKSITSPPANSRTGVVGLAAASPLALALALAVTATDADAVPDWPSNMTLLCSLYKAEFGGPGMMTSFQEKEKETRQQQHKDDPKTSRARKSEPLTSSPDKSSISSSTRLLFEDLCPLGDPPDP